MDGMMALWILLWGLLPPVLTGVWAYYQGKKGLKMALEARDIALKKVEELQGGLDLMKVLKKVDPETGKSPLMELREAITATIDGKVGAYARAAQNGEQPPAGGDLVGNIIAMLMKRK